MSFVRISSFDKGFKTPIDKFNCLTVALSIVKSTANRLDKTFFWGGDDGDDIVRGHAITLTGF